MGRRGRGGGGTGLVTVRSCSVVAAVRLITAASNPLLPSSPAPSLSPSSALPPTRPSLPSFFLTPTSSLPHPQVNLTASHGAGLMLGPATAAGQLRIGGDVSVTVVETKGVTSTVMAEVQVSECPPGINI